MMPVFFQPEHGVAFAAEGFNVLFHQSGVKGFQCAGGHHGHDTAYGHGLGEVLFLQGEKLAEGSLCQKHGKRRSLNDKDKDQRAQKQENGQGDAIDIAVNRQGGFGFETGFLLHDDLKISMLVVDEAHYIKNPDAKRTRNTRKLCDQAERLLFMTGTALENRVDEMIALMQILRPEVAVDVKNVAFLASAPQFREKVSPVYFRRKRDEVLAELPDLIENMEWCALGPEEEAVYKEAVLSDHFQNARRVSWSVDDLSLSSKARRLQEIVEDAAEDGRKIIVFSFFLNTISKVSALLGNRCVDPITGSVSPKRRQEIIDEFEKAPAGAVLPAQILAGGTGLNIQAASVVVICEPQLKPSIENQAISRAYRMGQARNVLVYRLLADETIDERITDLLNEKQIRFDAFADESVLGKESIQIDETGIKEIMEEEKQRILNT